MCSITNMTWLDLSLQKVDTGFAFPKSGHQALWQTIVEVNKNYSYHKEYVSDIGIYFYPSRLLLGASDLNTFFYSPTNPTVPGWKSWCETGVRSCPSEETHRGDLYCCIIRSNLAKSKNYIPSFRRQLSGGKMGIQQLAETATGSHKKL